MLLLAAVAIVAMPDWVPARWFSKDPATLKLVDSTPVNCLLLEKANWSPEFAKAAAERGIATLGVVKGNAIAAEVSVEAKKAGLTGLAVEGSLSAGKIDMPVMELKDGVWPGIHAETTAGPTGAPWIDTNTGFLRYARVSSHAPVWIAERAPGHPPVAAYLAAIGDAGMTGARWVLDFDDEFAPKLAKGDAEALKNWALIVQHVKFYEDHKEWREFSLRSVAGSLPTKMVVNADARTFEPEIKAVLKAFMKVGGTWLMGPPGWRFPGPEKDQIRVEKKDLAKLEPVWEEVNAVTGHDNLGARLFNVGSVLSNLLESKDGKRVALHLVNYSDYPVEDITVRVAGKFKKATLMRPDAGPQKLEVYDVEEGMGVDVPAIGALATIVLEQ